MPLNNTNSSRKEVLRLFEAGQISISKVFKSIKEEEVEQIGAQEGVSSQQDRIKEVIDELNKLVGLDNIKELVKELKAFVKIQQVRKQRGLKSDPLVLHMIFKGNPGTGKTTVARIFGKLFKELGVLETGELQEVERADLVGEYIGHTAKKTREVIDKALGGILFIDEAYSLARGGKKDFGKETIDTLVKEMEDNKDNLIIILAGYPQEMDHFLSTNPGLKSRFPIQIEFEDYTLDQLVEIASLMLKNREYELTSQAETKFYSLLAKIRQEKGTDSGNARTVRNIIERLLRKQATRLADLKSIKKEELITITKADLHQLTIDEIY
ncbi:AAA+ family ATPase [Halobacteroides halobius DSM 5150]|uniref:AAA+ family ATPase n=1 Tax=Halobacteroides halobius (strain ATCC 35273 / DSM 5150 / MD-1) TaxID=748449 RepID=L0K8R3_HALHC|nr:AAA family ATPase [Halobacteroides halobius]AGB40930.1 AAA+ family ATPase [Halobacteroides halobius DSM 5150]